MNQPKISIIIPVNNVEGYLRSCLDTVVAQTYSNLEIICIDDGSTDFSLKVLKEYQQKDNRFVILHNSEKKGQAYSRNRGLEVSTGEYIGFVDSDDWIDEKMFEILINKAISLDADIVMSPTYVFNEYTKNCSIEDGYYNLTCFDSSFDNRLFSPKETKDFLLNINVAIWNKIYKKAYLESINVRFFEGYIFEDLPFFYDTYLKTNKVALVRDFLYFYRTNRLGSTMTGMGYKLQDRVDMVAQTYQLFKETEYFPEIKSMIDSWVIDDLFHRYTLVEGIYQKEFFYRMKKMFCFLSQEKIDKEKLAKSYCYEEFLLIQTDTFQEFNKKLLNKYRFIKKHINELEYEKYSGIRDAQVNCEQKIEKITKETNQKIEQELAEKNKYFSNEIENMKNWYFEQQKYLEKFYQEQLKLQKDIAENEKNQFVEDFKKQQEKITSEYCSRINAEKDSEKNALYQEMDSLRQSLENEKNEIENKCKKEIEADKLAHEEELNQKLNSQQEWFEKEMARRLSEVDLWHNDNLKNKLAALTNEKNEQLAIEINNKNNDIEKLKSYYETEILKQKQHFENEIMFKVNEIETQFNKDTKYLKTIIRGMKYLKKLHWKLRTTLKKSQPIVKNDFHLEKPKVSIILPVYNVEKYLPQCLDSLINQTLKDIEIICVNDGSNDGSAFVLEQYRQKDTRIKVIHKKNQGTGAARNDGLKIATGECIGFVDPDDWVKTNMFERLYKILKEKDLDIVMCMPAGFDEGNQKEADFPYFVDGNFQKELDNKIFSWRNISPFAYPMCVWNKLYKKELFDKNNIDFAEGLDFEDHKVIFHTLLAAEKIFFIREKLYIYRFNRKGSILSDNNRRLLDHMEIFNIVEDILKKTNTYDSLRMDFLRYKIHNILYYYSMIKDEHKQEYYERMIQSLKDTNLSQDEKRLLAEQYPELNTMAI